MFSNSEKRKALGHLSKMPSKAIQNQLKTEFKKLTLSNCARHNKYVGEKARIVNYCCHNSKRFIGGFQ